MPRVFLEDEIWSMGHVHLISSPPFPVYNTIYTRGFYVKGASLA